MKVLLTVLLMCIGCAAFAQNSRALKEHNLVLTDKKYEQPADAQITSAVKLYLKESATKNGTLTSRKAMNLETVTVKLLKSEAGKTYTRVYQGQLPIYESMVLEQRAGIWTVVKATTFSE